MNKDDGKHASASTVPRDIELQKRLLFDSAPFPDRSARHDILFKQYEKNWHEVNHLDTIFVQATLLSVTLMSAYIGVVDKKLGDPILISVTLMTAGICIIGAIVRLRWLIQRAVQMNTIIEQELGMIPCLRETPPLLARVRTSVYLAMVVGILTAIAIVLTLKS